MLITQQAPSCATCGLSRESLPSWARDLGALHEAEPGIYQCEATASPILPNMPELDDTEKVRLEHELQLFVWLTARAFPGQPLGTLTTTADVVTAIDHIDKWAIATDTVIYMLRHWPLGRIVITAYDRSGGHDADEH